MNANREGEERAGIAWHGQGGGPAVQSSERKGDGRAQALLTESLGWEYLPHTGRTPSPSHPLSYSRSFAFIRGHLFRGVHSRPSQIRAYVPEVPGGSSLVGSRGAS